jgi:PAB-dependent poly(A)-specific ribonuclease subunit 2
MYYTQFNIFTPPSLKGVSGTIPDRFKPVKIKLSKLGISDFDFSALNKTSFVGLENAIPNSYVNSVLQMLYFIPEIRIAVERHTCSEDVCLCCELSFLMHMLDQAQNSPGFARSVHATNFQRSLRLVPEAIGLGLIEPSEVKLIQRAHQFFQFLLEHLNLCLSPPAPPLSLASLSISESTKSPKKSNKGKSKKPTPSKKVESVPVDKSIFDSMFGADVYQVNRCLNCGTEVVKYDRSNVLELQYLSTDNVDHIESVLAPPPQCFADLMKNSLCRKKKTRAWCDKCNNYQQLLQTRSYRYTSTISLCIYTTLTSALLYFQFCASLFITQISLH